MSQDELASRVVRSAGWLYVQKIGGGLVKIAGTAVLARMLTPRDFGVVALGQVVMGFLVIVGSGGIMEFVIYDRHEQRAQRLSAAFWCNAVLTVAFAAVAVAARPLTLFLSEDPLLADILLLLIVRYMLEQMAAVPEGLIRKSLSYRAMAVADVVLSCISVCMSIGMVLTGWGVWSLVIPLVLEYALKTVWYFRISSWLPSLHPHVRHWRDILRYTLHIRVSLTAGMVAAEGDTLIVGRLLGSHLLGLYNMAYQTSTFVKRGFITALGSLAMPALAQVGTDEKELATAMRRGVRVIALLTFPLLAFLFITAGNVVGVLYGPQWGGAVLPLRVLLLFAFVHCLSSPASAVYNVLGKPQVGARIGVAMIPVYLAAVWLGAQWGIVGAAVAVTTVRIGFGLAQVRAAAKLTGQRLIHLLQPLGRVIMFIIPSAAAAGCAQVFARHILATGQLLTLLVSAVIFAVTAFTVLRTIGAPLVRDLQHLAESLSPATARFMRFLLPSPHARAAAHANAAGTL